MMHDGSTPQWKLELTIMPCTQRFTYLVQKGSEVTDEQIKTCSDLFNANYGVWGSQASLQSDFLKPGTRVKLPPRTLREKLSLRKIDVLLCTCRLDGSLIAHAFASTWNYGHGNVLWITQLVVRSDHRRKGIATTMLRNLRRECMSRIAIQSVGIASSHPGACMALSKSVDVSMREVDLSHIKAHALEILSSTPVEYLRGAPLRGSLFDTIDSRGAIASVDTGFFVDHDEPAQAQAEFEVTHGMAWPLGQLLEGHEFIVILKV